MTGVCVLNKLCADYANKCKLLNPIIGLPIYRMVIWSSRDNAKGPGFDSQPRHFCTVRIHA